MFGHLMTNISKTSHLNHPKWKTAPKVNISDNIVCLFTYLETFLFEMQLVSLEEFHWKWQILYTCILDSVLKQIDQMTCVNQTGIKVHWETQIYSCSLFTMIKSHCSADVHVHTHIKDMFHQQNIHCMYLENKLQRYF